MNLKENYERFFGKMSEHTEPVKQLLDKSTTQRFSNIASQLSMKYPNAPLTIKDGFVYMGFKKIEEANKFINRSNKQIHEMVRSFSNSNKRGLV